LGALKRYILSHALVRSAAMEKHGFSKIDFEQIENAFKILVQSDLIH
jgi:hypothetical protein